MESQLQLTVGSEAQGCDAETESIKVSGGTPKSPVQGHEKKKNK